jgi:hypothetical protein
MKLQSKNFFQIIFILRLGIYFNKIVVPLRDSVMKNVRLLVLYQSITLELSDSRTQAKILF